MLRLGHAEDRPPGCVYRHQGRGRAAALRSGAAGGLSGAGGAGLCRAAQGAAVQGRAVQPDLSAGNPVAEIRAAAEAARQAAAVGARGRSRIPRHPGADRQALSGGRAGALLRRRERHRHAVLRDGLRRGPRVLESRDAGIESARARGDLRRDGRDPGAAALLRSGGPRAFRLRPRRELRRPPGRSLVEAVPRLADAADRRDGAADRMAAGAHPAVRPGAARARRLPARQHDLRRRIRRGCSRCSTGSCPRSAMRSPTSATT